MQRESGSYLPCQAGAVVRLPAFGAMYYSALLARSGSKLHYTHTDIGFEGHSVIEVGHSGL